MSEEKYGICPFNTSHRIVLYRMPAHILKCRKNYLGPPLERCPYNATHFVQKGSMAEHLQQCRDCSLCKQGIYCAVPDNYLSNDA